MAITLREGLGRKLTIAEMDENFTFLSGSYVVNSITSSMTVGNASSASVAARATLLSPAATASFADSATTASHAVTAASASYAISASHEISYETSSSLAETASFARTGDGVFSGSFSGSYVGDGSSLSGVIASGSIQTASVALRANSLSPTVTASFADKADEAVTSNIIPVTVVNDGGNKYAFNGVTAPTLSLNRGERYRFDLSNASNDGHPFAFRLLDDTSYTVGVTTVGTAGNAGAYVDFDVNFATSASLKYYCTSHGNGMGNRAQIVDVLGGITSGSFSGSFQGDGGDLTGIASYTVANSTNNRVLTSVDASNGNAEANLTFDGSTLTVAGSINETSAARYKENIQPIANSLAKVIQLNPVEYDWKRDGKHDLGLIAEEVYEILPDLVSKEGRWVQGISYSRLTTVLIGAIKELSSRIEELENK